MSYAEAVHSILSGDSALSAILEGGIYLYKDLKPEDINRDSTPDAYDSNGLLLPVAFVKGRAVVPTSEINDYYSQYSTLTQTIEVWMYDDTQAGWDELENAAGLVYGLLQFRPLPGTFDLSLTNEQHDDRDMSLGGWPFVRLDFKVTGFRSQL